MPIDISIEETETMAEHSTLPLEIIAPPAFVQPLLNTPYPTPTVVYNLVSTRTAS